MTQILKILDVDDGKWKQDFGVFSFWELSFSGIFVKLSKEWDPPIWLVPSHNVSFQKSVWHSHSNPFFSLSLLLLHFFFLLPRALSSHWPFIAPPQAATTTPIVTITSNHQINLEWDSIEVNCKRIQLENSFWGEGYVYLCFWFVWVFIVLVFIVWMNICIYEIWSRWY